MSLFDLISALNTKDVNVTVTDGTSDAEIIVFKSQGINGVESDVSSRNVRRWEITGATAIKVVLEAAG